MDWIQQWQSKLNKQNGVAPLVRTGGSRHTGLAALPYRNIHPINGSKQGLIHLHILFLEIVHFALFRIIDFALEQFLYFVPKLYPTPLKKSLQSP